MNPNNNSRDTEEFSDEIQDFDTVSIDDFFKELEAKEKALDISPEMVIEIDEADFGGEDLPEFLKPEMPVLKNEIHTSFAPNSFSAGKDLTAPLENKISNLQNQLSKFESERAELLDSARRRSTDFDNFKKRTERERSETFRNQLGNLANQILPVMDNLDRALNAASNFNKENSKDFQQFFEGIMLVSQQLNEILAEMGVQPIASVGESFDPHFHEAVATEETDEFSPHTIIEELLRGYRIGEKVIRPSMVKVASAIE